MSLNRFKKKTFEATRKFTDREKPRESFWKLLNDETFPLKVLVYYGFGGIGKTTLLKSLRDELRDRKQRDELKNYKVVFISLEAFEFNSPTDILIAIRNQLEVSSVLFDYALLKYWSVTGHSVLDMKKKMLPDDSIAWEVIDMVADGSAPYKLVKKGFEILQNKYHKTFSRYKETILEINSFDEMELWERLPYYLGLSLADAYERKNIKHIIFLDTYEAMLRKLENKVVTHSKEQWIMDLIGSSEVALFVLGSREFVKWADYDKEWETVLEQHILGVLINKDADYYLQSVPILEQEIREAIIETANGIPLYLDLCVTIYENKKSWGESILSDDFRLPLNQVIERFLRHLSLEEREVVKILGLINFFDYELFKYFIQLFNIGFPLTLFDLFTNKSFIYVLDTKLGLFKVHDSIREYIMESTDLKLKKEVWDKSLEIVAEGSKNLSRSFELKKKYFAYILSMLHEIDYNDIKNTEGILTIGFHLMDNGYWNDVGDLLRNHSSLVNSAFKEAYHLLNAVYLRRKGCLSEAKAEVAKIKEGKESIGRYEVLYRFTEANIVRLSGEYDEAEKLYKQVIESLNNQGKKDKFYIKVSRQYADLLFFSNVNQKVDHRDNQKIDHPRGGLLILIWV
ncbi:hypothetical protein JCM14036_14730 [Desulfotomaculum defluvii]